MALFLHAEHIELPPCTNVVNYPSATTSATGFTRYVTLPLSRGRFLVHRYHPRRAGGCRGGIRRGHDRGAARRRLQWLEVEARAPRRTDARFRAVAPRALLRRRRRRVRGLRR